MGVLDGLRGEFVDIIEWLDDTRDTIAWRFPRHDNEIKDGARLIVREGQVAVFVDQGQIADVFVPGTHLLSTLNLPLLSTLRGWRHGFDSPFKAEVYFVSTRTFTDGKWGTQNPALMRDAEFGMVRVRAFGAYSFEVVDPDALIKELVGTDSAFRVGEVGEHVRQLIVSRLVTALATSGIPVLDLAAAQGEIGGRLAALVSEDLAPLGLAVTRVVVENVSLPPEVEQAIDTRTRRAVAGDLGEHTRFQAAEAIALAAGNEGGGTASAGVGMGLGAALAGQIASATDVPAPSPTPAPAAPPALPSGAVWWLGADGVQSGPMTVAEVQAAVAAGDVPTTALAWREGFAAWTPLAEVAELRVPGPPALP